jgi:hypothetical protein
VNVMTEMCASLAHKELFSLIIGRHGSLNDHISWTLISIWSPDEHTNIDTHTHTHAREGYACSAYRNLT